MKAFLKNGLLVLCSIILTLLAAEGVLRFLPVNEGLRVQPVNEKKPIIHFEPNRTATWSRFADFSMVNTVHSNNYGFLNDQDYDPNGKLPLIAVIGDSYVEAAMIPYEETLHGRLAQVLKSKYRVYSFGVSGAPLSQYLAFAQFARDEFKPKKMIFVIVGNDFDESMIEYKNSGGFHYFSTSLNGNPRLERKDYAPSTTRNLLNKSALAMYLLTNLNAYTTLSRLASPKADAKKYVGQTSSEAEETRVAMSKQAVDYFFKKLPSHSGLPPQSILFVVDAMRPHMYSEEGQTEARGSYFDIMRTDFLTKAVHSGYPTIDLQSVFKQAFAVSRQRFEFPMDGHWNSHGHRTTSQTILKGQFIQ